MTLPAVVETDVEVELKIESPFAHQCPFRQEVDEGVIVIRLLCSNWTMELHELRSWLEEWRQVSITHEAVVDRIAADLGTRHPNITLLEEVTARFQTAGMWVEVRSAVLHAPD